MTSWISRLFRREEPESLPLPQLPDALLDQLQRLARQQAKLALGLEDLGNQVAAGFTDLRGLLRNQVTAGVPAEWDDALDALDQLDEAIRVAERQGSSEMAAGLRGVAGRLERFLAQGGLARHAAAGGAPDGRLFRVVGAAAHPDLPPGAIARVVRAAVTRGERLVREGEALVNQEEGE